jgi:hypothetical protein
MSDAFSFEGDEVTNFTAQLPSAMLEAPEAYQRGTLLTLTVQVRVKSVRIEEDRKGNLSRKHILALEEVNVTDVLTPAQRQALIDAAAAAVEEEAAAPAEYTVPEEFEPEESVYGGDDVVAARIAARADDDDDDPDHSWMDEEAEDGLHVDLSALAS